MAMQGDLDQGRYVLDRDPIASGGMGTVWRGYDRKLKRAVAVKELRFAEGLSESDRARQWARVMVEARAAARLDHPGIVPVYDVIEDDGRAWIVMRLVPGRSLAQEVDASGALSPQRTAEIGLEILAALEAAHAEGILHRDVKPQNVLLDDEGKAVLTDFGIASVMGTTQPLTATGMVVGTVGYVAPERLSGSDVGPKADLWSLGATLYFMVEGRPAYNADDVVAMIAAVATRDPEPMRRAGALAPAIAGLLIRDVGTRWDTEATKAYLQAVVAGRLDLDTMALLAPRPEAPTVPAPRFSWNQSPPAATPEAGDAPARPLRPRGLTWLVASAAAVALVAGGIAIGMQLTGGDGEAASKPPEANRFKAAPKICQSGLMSTDQVGKLVSQPRASGGPINTVAVNQCEFKSDSDGDSLLVEVMVHGSVKAATDLFEEPDGPIGRYRYATGHTSPALGDQAEAVGTSNAVVALVRISNLTIEIRHEGSGSVGFVMPFVRQVVAAAEAEARPAT
ncbi:serine/threonine protein kinase [Streptomyces sp. NBC_00250]|uniref:serine/threonine-protein kinase n=1 Tax=Streptomyces sp. NBC_00250 TaxID=2903641 RepID=UPI002E2E37E8|nr:serine/threonine-protein kinase [Streptomyces sp. NBC_00250]